MAQDGLNQKQVCNTMTQDTSSDVLVFATITSPLSPQGEHLCLMMDILSCIHPLPSSLLLLFSHVSDSLPPPGLQPPRRLCPSDFPDKQSTLCCRFLLQGIFLTQESNPHLLHWQADSLPLSHQGSPYTHYCIQKIANKNLLYSTGNCIWCSVMTYIRMESRKEWIYV